MSVSCLKVTIWYTKEWKAGIEWGSKQVFQVGEYLDISK